MISKIMQAVKTTLVIENKSSLHLLRTKILAIIKEYEFEQNKDRLIEIVDKLLDSTMIEPEIHLSYCDYFNKYSGLSLEVTVFLSFYTEGSDENERTFFSCSSVNVTKFDLLDESSDRVLNNSQESELVRMLSQHISDYYDNKGKRHI